MRTLPGSRGHPILLAVPLLLLGLGTALPGPGPEPLQAQEVRRPPVVVTPFLPGSGWLGIHFDVPTVTEAPGTPAERDSIRVRQVVPGSPAETGGVRAGDVVTHLQGDAASPEALRRHVADLEPGDRFRMRVLRDGRPVELELEAGERPDLILNRPSGEVMVFFADSLRTRFGIDADSIRSRFILHADSIRSFMQMNLDSLQVRRLRMQEEARRLEGEARRFEGEARRLGEHGRPFGVEVFRRRGGEAGDAPRIVVRTPGSIVTLGQRIVAGAEVTPMNPGLAAYFGVEEGVLVTEVLEETPAHAAGLRPGDVVVAVGGQVVRSVPELRDALDRGYRTPPVPVAVVREGEELRLEFRR
jgi:hypothetical protein